MATATKPITPTTNSCCFCGISPVAVWMANPRPKHIRAAATTPSHTFGIRRLLPDWCRKPATMPTISAASMPSRNIIRKAINIGLTYSCR